MCKMKMLVKSYLDIIEESGKVNMRFSKNDFEKVDLRIKKITEQTVEQIEVDSELPPTIEKLEDNNKTYSIMAAILFIDIRKSTYLTENS